MTRGSGHVGARLAAAALLAALCSAPGTFATLQSESEPKTKAALIAKLAKFIEWPEEVFETEDSLFVICVIGRDPIASHLRESIQGRTIRNRPVALHHATKPEEIRKCHLLFICPSETDQIPEILNALNGSSVLTVGAERTFLLDGGMVNLLESGQGTEFDINLIAAQQGRLAISSKLLSLARMVIMRQESGDE